MVIVCGILRNWYQENPDPTQQVIVVESLGHFPKQGD